MSEGPKKDDDEDTEQEEDEGDNEDEDEEDEASTSEQHLHSARCKKAAQQHRLLMRGTSAARRSSVKNPHTIMSSWASLRAPASHETSKGTNSSWHDQVKHESRRRFAIRFVIRHSPTAHHRGVCLAQPVIVLRLGVRILQKLGLNEACCGIGNIKLGVLGN